MNITVLGASGVIGTELAVQFSSRVRDTELMVLVGRDTVRLENTYNRCARVFGTDFNLLQLPVDGLETSLDRVTIEEYLEDTDLLINCAGEYSASSIYGLTRSDLESVLASNFTGPAGVITDYYNILHRNRRDGTIININSIAALYPGEYEPAYRAAKHAMRSFITSLRMETRRLPNRIRILEVYLGAVQSSMTRKRPDYAELMDPCDVAEATDNALGFYNTLQLETMTLGRLPDVHAKMQLEGF